MQTFRGRVLQSRVRFANLLELNGWMEAERVPVAQLQHSPAGKG